MGLGPGPAACMNHEFTLDSQVWDGDPQLLELRPLAQIQYDAFVTSALYRDFNFTLAYT